MNPMALYNEILGGILDRIPGGFAMHHQMTARRSNNITAADASRAITGATNEAQTRPRNVSPPTNGIGAVPFSALFEYFSEGGQIDPILREAIEAEIDSAAARHNLNPDLVRAVIRAESNYRHDVVSHAGAMGLMQLMPRTAESLGVVNPFDIRQNIDGGTRYLRRMLDLFGGDLDLALAAYNAGQGAVRRHGGIPPFAETQNYVPRVRQFMEEYALTRYRQSAEDSRIN